MKNLRFVIFFLTIFCTEKTEAQPINDECEIAVPMVIAPSLISKFSIGNASQSLTYELFYASLGGYTNGRFSFAVPLKGPDVWFVLPNHYDLFTTSLSSNNPNAKYTGECFVVDCDTLIRLRGMNGNIPKIYPSFLLRVKMDKCLSTDSIKIRFNSLYKGSNCFTNPNSIGLAFNNIWKGNHFPTGGDTINIGPGSKFKINYETTGAWNQYFNIGRNDSATRSALYLYQNSTVSISAGINVNFSDSIRMHRRSALLLDGYLNNPGTFAPFDNSADSIWLCFRGRGQRVLTGNDPYQHMNRVVGGETVQLGMIEIDYTGKMNWPWASKFKEVVLARGILAMKAGDSVSTNRLLRINGTLHSPIKPLRWAGSPFTLVYPKGADYGVWGKDIDWRQLQDFKLYMQEPDTRVILSTYHPDRDEEGSPYVYLDTSITARNITFNSGLMTRPQDTISVARNQLGWVHNGVEKLDPALPLIAGQPTNTKGIVGFGRTEVPFLLTINSQAPADAPVYLQGVKINGDLNTGTPADTFGIRIFGDTSLVLTDYRIKRNFWQTYNQATDPYVLRRGDYGLFQSHTPNGPWTRIAVIPVLGSPYDPISAQYGKFWIQQYLTTLQNQFQYTPIRFKNGTYFAFFTGTARHDLKTIGINISRKVKLDGYPNAPKRAVAVEVLNNGQFSANGYRVGCQVDGGTATYSSAVNNFTPLSAYANSDLERRNCTDTVWITEINGLKFTEHKLYTIKAWVEYTQDSSHGNDTMTYSIDLRLLPVGNTSQFRFGNTWGAFNTWSYHFAFPSAGVGTLTLSQNLVAESKALDSMSKGNFTNWLDPRFQSVKYSGDSAFAMGYEGINCTQPNDGVRTLTTATIGPIGNNAMLKVDYRHGTRQNIANPFVAIRSEDTIYVESSRNEGQSWDVLKKVHQGNQAQTFNPTTLTSNLPYTYGDVVRVRIRYQSKYQPLMATPFPFASVILDNLEISSDAFVENEKTIVPESGVVVFPNPGNGVFEVRCADKSFNKIIVSDMRGRRIESVTSINEDGNPTINIQAAPPGIYLLHIATNRYSKTVKIIKN